MARSRALFQLASVFVLALFPMQLRWIWRAVLSVLGCGMLVGLGPLAMASATLATKTAVNKPKQVKTPPPKGPTKQAPKKPSQKRRYTVAAMGDSLTDPRSRGGRYLELLRSRCPKSRFDSYGIGGQMVNQMRRRFARDVVGAGRKQPKVSYDHVLILGGINDICSDRSAARSNAKIRKDLSAMYRMAKKSGLTVVAMTMPPWGGFKRYYNRRRGRSTLAINAWIRKQAGGDVDRVVDIFPLLSCGQSELLCPRYGMRDKVHWNRAGHRVVGRALHRQVFVDCR